MPLPLALLRSAQGQPIMVELKNGETLSGILGASDNFMNLNLKELVRTSQDGEHFWKITECYVRGNNIKCFRFPDELYEQAAAMATLPVQEKKQSSGGSGPSEQGRGRQNTDWQPTGRGRGLNIDLTNKHSKFRRTGLGRST